MEIEKAKQILELSSWPEELDVLEEIIEEHTFKIKDYFLRNHVISLLFKARIRKLKQLDEILEQFFPSKKNEISCKDIQPVQNGLYELFKWFEFELAEQRKLVSISNDPKQIISAADQMIEIQITFENELVQYCNANGITPSDNDVKAADHINTGLALRMIQKGELKKINQMLKKELARIQLFKPQ